MPPPHLPTAPTVQPLAEPLVPTFPCPACTQAVSTLPPFTSSIPETVRILGSLLVILLLFALTAALVKVDMSPGPFFSITMASVWFINCEHRCPYLPPCPAHPGLQPSLFFVTERAQRIQKDKTEMSLPISLVRN